MLLIMLQIKGLSNVKEEVYGALDSFVAWDLEFPLIVVKKALKTLEDEKEWKRIIQVPTFIFFLIGNYDIRCCFSSFFPSIFLVIVLIYEILFGTCR